VNASPSEAPARALVLVVDHHAVFAEAVASRLSQEADLDASAGGRAAHALAMVPRRGVRAVVLEQWLADLDGLELTRQLCALPRPPVVVFLGDTASPAVAAAAFQSGALAWVGKESPIEVLLEALRAVLQGQMFVSPGMLGPLLRLLLVEQGTGSPSRLRMLTPRERDVLGCMVDGLDQASSAKRLFLSPNTVRTHRQKLLAKLGVHSSLEAVAIGRQAGLKPRVPSR
jgi:DNA-binding NarL/FixJ family response regulator